MAFTLSPAKGDEFVDREELMDELLKTLLNKNIRMGFALYPMFSTDWINYVFL